MVPKKETFDEFLTQSFANDVYFRELRLSQEEVDYVLKKYPKSSLKQVSEESSDGKCWYEVNLLPTGTPLNITKPLETENHRLEAENQRLKEELEALKKSLLPIK